MLLRFLMIMGLSLAWGLLLGQGSGGDSDDFDEIRVNPSRYQDKQPRKPFGEDVLFVGSDFGLGLFNAFYVNLGPYAGIRLGPHLALGLGGMYSYFAPYQRNRRGQSEQHIYGYRVFGRIKPMRSSDGFYLHGELEQQHLLVPNPAYQPTAPQVGVEQFLRRSVPMLNCGFGYTSNFHKGLGYHFEILYNVFHLRGNTIYASPIISKAGFYYGF